MTPKTVVVDDHNATSQDALSACSVTDDASSTVTKTALLESLHLNRTVSTGVTNAIAELNKLSERMMIPNESDVTDENDTSQNAFSDCTLTDDASATAAKTALSESAPVEQTVNKFVTKALAELNQVRRMVQSAGASEDRPQGVVYPRQSLPLQVESNAEADVSSWDASRQRAANRSAATTPTQKLTTCLITFEIM